MSDEPGRRIDAAAKRVVAAAKRFRELGPSGPSYRAPVRPPRIERTFPITAGKPAWVGVSRPLLKALFEAIENRRWPIYLCGAVGTGKTCAAALLYRDWDGAACWHEAGSIIADVVACRAKGEVTHWLQDGTPRRETEFTIRRKLQDASLAVFNDLGLCSLKDTAYEVLFSMIDLRRSRATIYTSNLDPERLEKVYDDRIVSRVCAGSVIHVVGDDRRAEGSRFVRVKAARSQ